MSFMKEARQAKRELYQDYRRQNHEIEVAEREAVKSVLNSMEKAGVPMTAKEVSAKTGLSSYEVAGNLLQIRHRWCSRYALYADIEIGTKSNKWCLLDEEGNPTNIIKETDKRNTYLVTKVY